jgi:hypothetical protein
MNNLGIELESACHPQSDSVDTLLLRVAKAIQETPRPGTTDSDINPLQAQPFDELGRGNRMWAIDRARNAMAAMEVSPESLGEVEIDLPDRREFETYPFVSYNEDGTRTVSWESRATIARQFIATVEPRDDAATVTIAGGHQYIVNATYEDVCAWWLGMDKRPKLGDVQYFDTK